jgi:hypothetical protein
MNPSELRELLADDLESRAERLQSDLDFLNEATLNPAALIQGAEMSLTYGADEELLELEEQMNPLWLGDVAPTAEAIKSAQAAAERYRERQNELEAEHRRRVSPDLPKQAPRIATRLRRHRDPSRIVLAYRDFDVLLTELEGYVEAAVPSRRS